MLKKKKKKMATVKTTANEFFESIGQKVQPSSEDAQPVEVIESLCMNCEENVCIP